MFSINSSGNFKSESFKVPKASSSGGDDFSIRMSDGKSAGLKSEKLGGSGMRPMFPNSSSGKIGLPGARKVNLTIKPRFGGGAPSSSASVMSTGSSSSKVPVDSFSAFSNSGSESGGDSGSEGDDSDDGDMGGGDAGDDDEDESQMTPRSRASSYSRGSGGSMVSGSGSGGSSYASGSSGSGSESGSEYESGSESGSEDGSSESGSEYSEESKEMSYEEIQREKQTLLFELERLQKAGFPPSKRYSMASEYAEMKFERDRLKRMRDVERSIKFSRKMLLGFVGGVEYLNKQFNPADLKLNGWSENMMENIADYDEVFEELHDKYADSVKMPPEVKLVMMVAGSGFMFHMTNSFLKSAAPDLRDVLKNNPDIMANINAAAAKNMGAKIDQEYGRNNPIASMMRGGLDMRSGGGAQGQRQMSGPANIDDLLGGDDGSVGEIKSFGKRGVPKKSGISLSL